MRGAALLALALAAAGCPVAPTPPAEADLAQVRKEERAPTPPPMPVTAEVEVAGVVDNREKFKGDVTVYVADAPCWTPEAKAFGSTKTQIHGEFFVEVFVPQGTNLYVCAATADGLASGALAAPLLGKGLGEVTYPNQKLSLVKGKKVTAPPPKVTRGR